MPSKVTSPNTVIHPFVTPITIVYALPTVNGLVALSCGSLHGLLWQVQFLHSLGC